MRPSSAIALLNAALTSLISATSLEAQHARIRVSPNVHVSAARPDVVHDEVLLSASSDPNLLIACSMAGPPNKIVGSDDYGVGMSGYDIVYVSTDAGTSWSLAIDTTEHAGDNHCAIGPDHRMYFTGGRLVSRAPLANRLIVQMSSDSGRTWQDAAVHPPESRGIDRQFFAIDDSQGPQHGRIYITGTTAVSSVDGGPVGRRLSALALWRSLDGGETFGRPLTSLAGDSAVRFFNPWQPVIMRDGTLVFPFAEQLSDWSEDDVSKRMKVIASRDAGDSFDAATVVGTMMVRRDPSRPLMRQSVQQSLAVDRTDGPFADRLYQAWADQQNGGDAANSEILVAYSDDQGRTWSRPIRVGEYPPSVRTSPVPRNAMPALAVNNAGVVGLLWYDRRVFPDGMGYDVRFAASTDGGETWTPSVKVSERPMTYHAGERTLVMTAWGRYGGAAPGRVGIRTRFHEWIDAGHTTGFAADGAGRFHAVWVDNRTGIHQLWTSMIEVDAAASVDDLGFETASLQEVSDSVELEVVRSAWNPETAAMEMQLRLVNRSSTPIAAPLYVRVVVLESEFGRPVIVGADNGIGGPGALLDFSGTMVSGGLAPGGSTAEKAVTIELADFESFAAALSRSPWGVLRLEARVMGDLGKSRQPMK